MTTSRVGSANQQALLLSRIQEVQARLVNGQGQLSSGLKTPVYSGLGSSMARYLDLSDDVDRTNSYLDNIRVAQSRVKLTETALGGMSDVADDMNGVSAAAPVDYQLIGIAARGNLTAFAALLNETDGSRALFGGSNVAGPAVVIYEPGTGPVADGVTVFGSTAAGTTNDGYRYQILATGTAADVAIQIDDATRVEVQINANPTPAPPASQNAFTETLNALVNFADFDSTANPIPTDADLQAARLQLRNATAGSTGVLSYDALRTQNSARSTLVQSVENSHKNFKKYAEDTLVDIQSVDTAEVAAQLTLDQVRLEASYSALARINQLSLLDYLR
jgi:flagellar hook-associated protein 3 FlgL